MAVVGIDFGNLNVVIAQAQRGGVDVILNESSNRQNANMVSIQDKQRYMGDQASAIARSNYKNTMFGTKRLIGRRYADPDVQEEIKTLPFKAVQTGSGGIGYEVTYDGEPVVLMPEQVTSMMLNKVNSIVKAANGGLIQIADAVVAIPGWYTDAQRRAVLDAAEIAGINVLRLIHESTAVALSYGIYKSVRNLFHEKEPQYVLFLDIGHSQYSATVVAFIQGKLIVKSSHFDIHLGGREFDALIVGYLAEKFQEKYKKNPLTNVKAKMKLEQAAEKAKKTLSPAGVNEVAIDVECVMDEIDLHVNLPLAEFEKRCQPLLERLERPIVDALKDAGIGPEQLANVEIVGGGTRVNCVKQRIASILKLDRSKMNYGLSTTLNADEAVSRGCALQCAILSSRFQVKPFEVIDAVPYSVKLSWDQSNAMDTTSDTASTGDEGDAQEAAVAEGANSLVLFARNDEMPKTKRITFNRAEDFTITAAYDESMQPLLPKGTDLQIGKYTMSIPKEKTGEKQRVRVNVMYNIHGLLQIQSAQLMEEVPPEPAPAPQTEEKTEEAVPTDGTAAPEGEATKEGAAAPSSPAKEAAPAPPTPKKKFRKVTLNVAAQGSGLSKAQKDNFVELEAKMEHQDRIIRETADMRNALESYIYEMKDKLIGNLRPFVTEEASATFSASLASMEDWLYGDGFDSTKSIYSQKLSELKKHGDPIQRRQYESTKREGAKADFLRVVEDYKNFAKSQDEKYSHITDEERAKVRDEANIAESWLYDQLALQAEVPTHADPVLTLDGIKKRLDELTAVVQPIMNKPKPAPKPAENKEEPKANGEGATPAEGAASTDGDKMNVEEPTATESEPMDTTG